MKTKIGIIGAGAYGTALAKAFSSHGRDVEIWARSKQIVEEINTHHTNKRYTGGSSLPSTLLATQNLEELCKNSGVIVYACPSSQIFTILTEISKHIGHQTNAARHDPPLLINTAKGIDVESLRFHHQLAEEIFSDAFVQEKFLCLSGPSFAAEIVKEQPTCVTLAGFNESSLSRAQRLLASPLFRIYTTTDLIGCQLGGAFKNVIAIATGITAGMGLGHNTQAAFINLGLSEMARLGIALGARTETFLGLSGMGDLILTCTSELSRNRSFGLYLGQGKSIDEAKELAGSTVEGIAASKAVHELIKKTNIRAPICKQIFAVLHNSKSPHKALHDLLSQPQGYEWMS